MSTYGVQVRNLTLGTELHTTRGDEPDPTAPVQLVDPIVVTSGFDPFDFPGPLVPATAQFSLFVAEGTDEPGWLPGHVVRVRIVVPPAGVPDWWTLHADTVTHWVDRTMVIAAPAAARAATNGLYLDYTCADPIVALLAHTVDDVWPLEEALVRWANVVTNQLPTSLNGFDLTDDPGLFASGQECGPSVLEASTLDEFLRAFLGGVLLDAAPSPPALGVAIVNATYDANDDLTGFSLESKGFDRTDAGYTTPYQLVLTGDTATRQQRPVPDVASGIIDAHHVRIDQVAWAINPAPNAVRWSTVKDDGSPGQRVAGHGFQRVRHGTRLRDVTTINRHAQATDDLADAYLSDGIAGEPRWFAELVTIGTDTMRSGELEDHADALRFRDGRFTLNIVAQRLVVVGVDPRWELGPNAGDIAGTLIGTTTTVTDGRLEVTCTLYPEVPRPVDGTNAATYQDLLDDVELVAVQYQGPGDHIDPSISYYDMRLIGV